MIILAWTLAALIGLGFVVFVWALMRQSGNEYADGVEIAEEDIAGALERDLRAFIDSENAKRCTGRIVNYTSADHARAVS